jgi:integrase
VRWQSRGGKTQSATRDTFEEAVEYRQERLREMRFGSSGDISGGRMDFCTWFEHHHLPLKEQTRSQPSTRATRRTYYRNHIAPKWLGWALAEISQDDIEGWLCDLGESNEVATVRKIYGYFREAMERAVNKKQILGSPTASIVLAERGLELPDSRPRFLDPVEVVLLEDAFDAWWRLVVPFLSDSGLRIGELAALRVRNVDLLRGSVRVNMTVAKDEAGRLIEGPPKTKAGNRIVATLGPDIVERVAEHIKERNLGPDDYLFHGPRGGRMNPDNWRDRHFNPAVERAGLADPLPTPHSLRHTAVSLWIASGVCKDVTKVAQFAGHEQLASVYNLYGHLFETSGGELGERMQAFREAARLELEGRGDEAVAMDRLRRPGRTA